MNIDKELDEAREGAWTSYYSARSVSYAAFWASMSDKEEKKNQVEMIKDIL